MNYSNIKRTIISQQDSNDFYFNIFTRYMSIHLTYILIKLKIKANQVTLFMLIPALIGMYFISKGTAVSYLVGGVLFVIHDILDTCDGEICRYNNEYSNIGALSDSLIHFFSNFFMIYFSVIGIGYISDFEYIREISCLFAFIMVIDMYLKLKFNYINLSISNNHKNNKSSKQSGLFYKINSIFFGNVAFFHLILITSLIDIIVDQSTPHITYIYIILFNLGLVFKFLYRLLLVKKEFEKFN
jgi:phosphatidylglycerophosphate synthase